MKRELGVVNKPALCRSGRHLAYPAGWRLAWLSCWKMRAWVRAARCRPLRQARCPPLQGGSVELRWAGLAKLRKGWTD